MPDPDDQAARWNRRLAAIKQLAEAAQARPEEKEDRDGD